MNRTFVLALALLVAACGGAAKVEHAPASSTTPSEPSSIEEAQAQIADARSALGGAGKAVAAESAPGDASMKTTEEKKPSADAAKESKDSCQSPCRAIASMRRAVGALCRMAGDEDARCLDAKRTLKESETRVAPCGC